MALPPPDPNAPATFNGEQITAALTVVKSVNEATIARATGEQFLQKFLGLSPEDAAAVLKDAAPTPEALALAKERQAAQSHILRLIPTPGQTYAGLAAMGGFAFGK